MTKISYLLTDNEWSMYSEYIQGLVKRFDATKICDVGGGANPVLSQQFIDANELDYTVLDISRAEIEKTSSSYISLIQNIEAVDFPLSGQFDFVFTKMLAEHIRNGKLFHKNVFTMLKPGGVAVHYFPTLYALPFLVNRLTPEWLSSLLLDIFLPRDRYQLGKFPAYYSWCYGPTPSMLAMLREIGYEIVEYIGIFGSTYYKRIPGIRDIHHVYTKYLAKHPNPYLTSFAKVILHKPSNTPLT